MPRGVRRGGNLLPANAGRARKQALFRALGIPWYGGRPRKPRVVLSLVQEAKRHMAQEIAKLEAALPPDILKRKVETLSAPEALGRASLSGFHKLVHLIEQPIVVRKRRKDPPPSIEELKLQRLVGDMSLGAGKLFARVAEGQLRAREGDALERLLAEITLARESDGTAKK